MGPVSPRGKSKHKESEMKKCLGCSGKKRKKMGVAGASEQWARDTVRLEPCRVQILWDPRVWEHV